MNDFYILGSEPKIFSKFAKWHDKLFDVSFFAILKLMTTEISLKTNNRKMAPKWA